MDKVYRTVFLLIILTVFILYFFTDFSVYLDSGYIRRALEEIGYEQALFYYSLIFIVFTVLTVPVTPISLVAPLLFGLWSGFLIVISSAMSGSILAFLISRYLFGDFLRQRFIDNSFYDRISRGIDENQLAFVIFVRMVPFFPFNWINYALGLTKLTSYNYLLGSLIGMAPVTFIYLYISSSYFGIIDDRGDSTGLNFDLIFSTILLAFLVIVSVSSRRKFDSSIKSKRDVDNG